VHSRVQVRFRVTELLRLSKNSFWKRNDYSPHHSEDVEHPTGDKWLWCFLSRAHSHFIPNDGLLTNPCPCQRHGKLADSETRETKPSSSRAALVKACLNLNAKVVSSARDCIVNSSSTDNYMVHTRFVDSATRQTLPGVESHGFICATDTMWARLSSHHTIAWDRQIRISRKQLTIPVQRHWKDIPSWRHFRPEAIVEWINCRWLGCQRFPVQRWDERVSRLVASSVSATSEHLISRIWQRKCIRNVKKESGLARPFIWLLPLCVRNRVCYRLPVPSSYPRNFIFPSRCLVLTTVLFVQDHFHRAYSSARFMLLILELICCG
jgi:hypothetical protein